jgi:hypothetical protein
VASRFATCFHAGILLCLFYPEDESSIFLWNVYWLSTDYTGVISQKIAFWHVNDGHCWGYSSKTCSTFVYICMHLRIYVCMCVYMSTCMCLGSTSLRVNCCWPSSAVIHGSVSRGTYATLHIWRNMKHIGLSASALLCAWADMYIIIIIIIIIIIVIIQIIIIIYWL